MVFHTNLINNDKGHSGSTSIDIRHLYKNNVLSQKNNCSCKIKQMQKYLKNRFNFVNYI